MNHHDRGTPQSVRSMCSTSSALAGTSSAIHSGVRAREARAALHRVACRIHNRGATMASDVRLYSKADAVFCQSGMNALICSLARAGGKLVRCGLPPMLPQQWQRGSHPPMAGAR